MLSQGPLKRHLQSSSPQPSLPTDIRLALEAATNLIAGLRDCCRQLRMIVWNLKNGSRRAADGGRYFSWDGGWQSDVEHFREWLQGIIHDLNVRAAAVSRHAAPLRHELETISSGQIGEWITSAGAITLIGERVAPSLARDVAALIRNRTKPYEDSEFLDLARRYEVSLDDLYTESLREARQLVTVRERDAMLSSSLAEEKREHFEDSPVPLPTASSKEAKPARKRKRSTERGEGRAKLIPALTKHHKYAEGGCLNLAPIGCNELAELAVVSPSTASAFFKKAFEGHVKYRAVCMHAGRLADSLKALNNEFSPHDLYLYGQRPADEDDRNSDRDE